MTQALMTHVTALTGQVVVPGDKSISHRSLMLGAVAHGVTIVDHFLMSADCLATMHALQALGVPISIDEETQQVQVQGVGFTGLHPADGALDMGNSGTSTRLLLGLLAKQPFAMTFVGDASLSQRPLQRVTDPLRRMGARYEPETPTQLPVTLLANQMLTPLEYQLPVASAQVKSALILAALQANGTSHITEQLPTRDHTERMLQMFGATITTEALTITVSGGQSLTGQSVTVPGDMSSAAFFIAAGLLVPQSRIELPNVGVNPTRTGLLQLVKRMGATIRQTQQRGAFEPVADLVVVQQPLHGIEVTATDIPGVIDELPILALMATQATGTTVISGAAELRVKETDRIATVVQELSKLGAQIEERPDGMVIHGGTPLHVTEPTVVDSHGDHRIAMMLAVAALLVDGEVRLADPQAMAVSYPDFLTDLRRLL